MSLKANAILRSLIALALPPCSAIGAVTGVWQWLLVSLALLVTYIMLGARASFSTIIGEEIDGPRSGAGQAAPGLREDR